MDSTGFQFDYIGYLRNMVFLIILLVVMSYILVKLKAGKQMPKLMKLPMLNLSGQEKTQYIEVLERNIIEGRKSVYLVKVFDDQYWLLGTTDTSMTLLGQVNRPSKEASSEQEFSNILEQQEQKNVEE